MDLFEHIQHAIYNLVILTAYLKPCETLTWHIQNPATGHYSAIFRILSNACLCRNMSSFHSWNIQNSSIIASQLIFITLWYENLRIFRTMTNLKSNTYLEPSQRFTIEFFEKIVKNYNYFFKVLHLRSLTWFWIGLFLNKYLLTWRVTSCYVLYNAYSEPCLLS